ncbi:MAG TPA: TetR/AcrR family transcriptional regulator [Solirubrobacteraceae bacterium]
MSTAARKTHREALLEAARSLLRERDYANITARELVAASNTNLGSIGYHFGSKEALLNEAIGQAFEEWTEAIGRATSADPDAPPLERMAGSWRAVLDEFAEIRPYFLAFLEALPRSARSPELAERLAAHYQRQRDRVAGMLTEALCGALDAGDARRLATFVIAISDGLMLQSFVDPDGMPTATELATSTAEALAKVQGRG